jgi:hypothetical protein
MFLFVVSVQCVFHWHVACGMYVGHAEEGRTVIEPVPEAVETILYKVLGCSEVEPGIDCTFQLANCALDSLR